MIAMLAASVAFAVALALAVAGPTGSVGGLIAGKSTDGNGGTKPATDGMPDNCGNNERSCAEQKQGIAPSVPR